MNPIEWLRYKLHGFIWRIPVWIIIFIIVILLITNVIVFIYKPWPHPEFTADIRYVFQPENVSNTGYHLYILVTGSITNIGNANGTCSIKIRVFEAHIGEYIEVIDAGTLAPGASYRINWKHYLYTYTNDSVQIDTDDIVVTYQLLY
jgi:hypothetical protein